MIKTTNMSEAPRTQNKGSVGSFVQKFLSPLSSLFGGFPCNSDGWESTYSEGDPGSIPGLGRSPGEGHGNPLQVLPGEYHKQMRLPGHSPWSRKELDTTELRAKELMLLKCGVGEDSWESLGLQGDPTSPSWRRSVLSVHWKDWCWSWNSNTLATSCKELTHWKRPWCWEGLGAGGEGDDRGSDGWMASPTPWTWVWVNSGSWWWTGRPGMLRFMGLQRVGHDWATELNWTELSDFQFSLLFTTLLSVYHSFSFSFP